MTLPPSPSLPPPSPLDLARRNRRTAFAVFVVVGCMVGLAFASVPLYRIFCAVTGFGGPTQMIVPSPAPDLVRDRDMQILFNSDVHPGMPWDFAPEVRSVTIKVGQEGLISFRAKNTGTTAVTGTAVYNVVPEKAAKYFHKTQCFCFGEQVLIPGQEMDMPVMFYVDPAIMDDPNMDEVQSITLSYTFYPAESEALDRAVEDYQNR